MPDPSAFDAFAQDEIHAIWLSLLLSLRHAQTSTDDDLDEGGGQKSGRATDTLIRALEAWRRREIVASPGGAVPRGGKLPVEGLDRAALKAALQGELKLSIAYTDAKGRATDRLVWPLSHTPFGPAGAMLAWCEKRDGFRNFRFDRIHSCRLLNERMPTPRAVLLRLAEFEDDDAGW